MKAEQILDQVPDLPPPPQVAWKLLELLKQPSQNNLEVIQIIEVDPVLTAKLLKACNSAFWARGEPVGTVRAALMKLGYQEVQRVTLALSVGGVLSSENKGYGVNPMELWNHSVVSGILSQKLAQEIKVPVEDPELAFTAGLLHDIGKTVLNQSVLGGIETIRSLVETQGKSLVEAEQEVLGVDHAEIGACLLRRWNFPEKVIQAVGLHHNPSTDTPVKLSAVVHVANCCAHLSGSSFGFNSLASRFQDGVLETMDMTSADIESGMISVHQEMDRITSFLNLA